MASSIASTARKNPLESIDPLINFNKFHHNQKIKTIRQVLLQDSDNEFADSHYMKKADLIDPVLEAVKELASDQCSMASQFYESARSNSFSQYIEPAKDSFTTARISMATTAAGSVKNVVEEPSGSGSVSGSGSGLGSTGSEISEETSLSSGIISTSSGLNNNANKPHKGNDSRWEAIQTVRARDGSIELKHFRLLKRLGCGDIGSVYLAELNGTHSYFAMKVMDKDTLEARKKLPRAQTEREILQCLDHPFLPTLYTHFETPKFSCLVMEYCPGGDLHALRQRQPGKYFSEQAARFYVAEVLLALEYLHMLGIIYRDLKPENVLVREDGHIMLSDFDLSLRCTVSPTLVKYSKYATFDSNASSSYCSQPACIDPPACMQPACFAPRFLKTSNQKTSTNDFASSSFRTLPELLAEPTSARSMSFVGTHEYLAPEIIKGEGHGSAVDWWTFGIFLYELLFGKTPFKGSGNRATLFNVVGEPLKFPEAPNVSFAARDLIRGLLVKEPQQRLAYRRGATEVKQHPFFQSVNWALIRCAVPPEVPRVQVRKNGSVVVDVETDGAYVDMDFF